MPDLQSLQSLDIGELLEVIRNPASNLTAAALIGAAFILVLLILVVVAWMLLLTTEDREKEKNGGQGGSAIRAKKRLPVRDVYRRRPPRWILPLTLVVIGAGLVVANGATGSDSRCLACHPLSVRPEAVEARHARCVECHERSAVLYALPNAVGRLRMQAGWSASDNSGTYETEALVGNEQCTACHPVAKLDVNMRESAEASGSVGVLMSHAEPVEAGMRCVECHGSVGAHISVDAQGGHPTMRLCIDCHDGTQASSRCQTCHVEDPARSVRVDPTPVAKTRLAKPADCSGCHSVESCDACHGIRLPHSEEFVKGGHAYQAAFAQRKRACGSCHEGTWCLETCHQGGNWRDPWATWGHPAEWASRHAREAESTCTNCHSDRFTCDYCHRRR